MDANTMKLIFDPFFTTKQRRPRPGVGRGLRDHVGARRGHLGYVLARRGLGLQHVVAVCTRRGGPPMKGLGWLLLICGGAR